MQRIMVIGCSGSGKSTLSVELAKKFNLPLVHLDKLFWCKNWQNVPSAEFDALLSDVGNKPAWIIDGNDSHTINIRFAYCDTVFFWNFPVPSVCAAR